MRLMDHLPEREYNGEEHVEDIQQALQTEVEAVQQARDDLMQQVLPGAATWGLEEYEKEYGIAPDSRKSWAQRLSRWRAKRRGAGTSTLERIHAVAQSFTDNEVTVTEYPREFRFAVEVSVDRPLEMGDMEDAIEEIKPAHLSMSYLIEYELHAALHAAAALQQSERIEIPYRQEPGWEGRGDAYLGAALSHTEHIAVPYTPPAGAESHAPLHVAAASATGEGIRITG